MDEKCRFKFNGGKLAMLCSNCSKIIKIGIDFSEKEKNAAYGEKFLEPQHCSQEFDNSPR
jgi:hypothetical protein